MRERVDDRPAAWPAPQPWWTMPPPGPARRYHRPGWIRVVLMFVLAAAIGAAGALTAASTRLNQLLDDLDESPASASISGLRDFDQQHAAVVIGALVVVITAHGFLIAWTARLYRNLRAFGITDQRFTDGWAIGAWFVPFLNLARPKQIIDDIWRASQISTRGAPWRRNVVSPLLHWWWAAAIAVLVVSRVIAPQSSDGPNVDIHAEQLSASFAVRAGVLVIVTLALEIMVVHQLSERHERAAVRLGLDGAREPGSSGTRLIASTVVLGTVLGIAGAVVTSRAIVDPFEAAAESTDGDVSVEDLRVGDVLVVDLRVGDCFSHPSVADSAEEELLAVDVMPCVRLHDAEVFAMFDLPDADDSPFPGRDETFDAANNGCFRRFGPVVGMPYMYSELSVVVLYPTPTSWSNGDRTVDCVAVNADGTKLRGTVADSGR